MRSTAKSPVYSAYPLKAIKESAVNSNQPNSPYLKALLSGTRKAGNDTQARVLVLNQSAMHKSQRVAFDRDKLPKDIELTEKGWFKSYE